MCSELKELLDTAIIRAGLNRYEVIKLEKALNNVFFVNDFLDDVYNNSDDLQNYEAKQFSYAYIKHYIKKDTQRYKIIKAKELLANPQSQSDKHLIEYAKSIYNNEKEQVLYMSQYVY